MEPSAVSAPLDVIQQFFEQNFSTDSQDWGELAHFERLDKEGLFSNVLMIQDCFDPEYFGGILEEYSENSDEKRIRHSKYQDFIPIEEGKRWRDIETMERTVYYCVPIPAETSWSKRFEKKQRDNCVGNPTKNKRQREDIEMSTETTFDTTEVGSLAHDLGRKRVKAVESCDVERDSGSERSRAFPDLNLPLPSSDGLPVLLKVYHDKVPLKMNMLVEVIGILSPAVPELSYEDMQDEEDEFFGNREERIAHSPPTSLVPRVHAILVKDLKEAHPYACDSIIEIQSKTAQFSNIRSRLIEFLSKPLGGDSLAAEYLMINMISRIYSRSAEINLGGFCLNFRNCNHDERGRYLQELVSSLVPKSHCLSVSREILNSTEVRVTPKKDYAKNRLITGQLQLAGGTHLILDERLTYPAGQGLTPEAVSKVDVLSKLVSSQSVDYDFHYYQSSFNTDFPLLLLSTYGSLLAKESPLCCELPLVSPLMAFSELQEYLASNEESLGVFREFLGLCISLQPHFQSLDQNIVNVIQNDYVEARKASKRIFAHDLHVWLTLVRYMAITFGEMSITQERWTYLKSREEERIERLVQLQVRV